LSGIFMTLFVRQIGASKAGSIFSGFVFALCGFMTAWQGQPMDDSATWLPLMCYAAMRLENANSLRSVALAAFAFAMPVLAGHPETAAHVTLVAIAIAGLTWAASHFKLRYACRFSLAGILAAGIASIQIIPTLEWLRQMPSALDLRWPVLPLHEALAWVSRDIIRGPNSAGISVPEGAAYVGMITLLAASIGLLHRAKRYVLFLAVLTAVALAIAYGIDPIHSFVSHVPVLSGLKNSRMILLASFGIAGLAGLGISVMEDDVAVGKEGRILSLLLVALAFTVAFLLVYKLRLATEFRVEFTRRPSFSRAMLIAALVPILLRLYTRLNGAAFWMIAWALLTFDLLSFSYGYMGFARTDEIFPRTGTFNFLKDKADPSHFRVAAIGIPYPPNANAMYGIASADGYEVRLTPLHRALSLDYAENRLDGIFFTAGRLLKFNDRRLDLLNVKHVLLETKSPEFQRFLSASRFSLVYNTGYVAAFENKTVLPRAFLVPLSGIKVLPEIDDQLAVLRDPALDPQMTVTVAVLPKALQERHTMPVSGLALTNNVETINTGINEVTLRYTSAQPSVLVFSQTFYPGWYADIDSAKTAVFPIDVGLTGAAVPAGLHDVRLVFRPASFTFGATVTALSIIVTLALARIKKPTEVKI
jgi:hypothetical protein